MRNHFIEDFFVYAENESGENLYLITELSPHWHHERYMDGSEHSIKELARARALILFDAMNTPEHNWTPTVNYGEHDV